MYFLFYYVVYSHSTTNNIHVTCRDGSLNDVTECLTDGADVNSYNDVRIIIYTCVFFIFLLFDIVCIYF